MKKIIIYAVAGLLSCTAIAQKNHELSVYGGGGVSALKYNSDFGDPKNKFGGFAGIGYKYFFTGQWGIGSGIEFSLYNSKFTFDHFSDKYMTKDMDGSSFEFRSTVNNYEEKQNALYLNIPLMLNFQTVGVNKFYAAAGGKIGIPLGGKYKTSGATIHNSGYYAEENYEYTTQEFMGFGTFADRKMNEDLEFKVAYILAAEAGMKWKLNDNFSLYTGAYFDYGLNDIRKDDRNKKFVTYNTRNPRDFTTNSIVYSQNGNNQNLSDKVIPMAAGVKISLAFNLNNKKKPQTVGNIVVPIVDNSTEEAARRATEEAEKARRQAEQEAEAKRLAEQQEKARIEAEMAQAKAIIEQPVSGYELNKTDLTPDKKEEIDGKIELLKKYPDWMVVCEGHTCDLGDKKVNEKIGLERAETAKEYMVKNGIRENRIKIVSKGDSQPIVPNIDEKSRRKNRRIDIIINK